MRSRESRCYPAACWGTLHQTMSNLLFYLQKHREFTAVNMPLNEAPGAIGVICPSAGRHFTIEARHTYPMISQRPRPESCIFGLDLVICGESNPVPAFRFGPIERDIRGLNQFRPSGRAQNAAGDAETCGHIQADTFC